MAADKLQPTQYPEVNALLAMLLAGVEAILGDALVGLYLYGSTALGAFNANSDVDFVVVTENEIGGAALEGLMALHDRIAASGLPYATELEGSYISGAALRRYSPPQIMHPHIDRGVGERLSIQQHDSDWIVQRYVLREHGITVMGPHIQTLIDPISADDLRQAVLTLLDGWWKPMIDEPALLMRPGYQAYGVVSMCRMLYTLKQGGVISKKAAADWAQTTLDTGWSALIQRALDGQAQADDVKRTQAFIRYTVDAALKP
jgi:hypothetical protein